MKSKWALFLTILLQAWVAPVAAVPSNTLSSSPGQVNFTLPLPEKSPSSRSLREFFNAWIAVWLKFRRPHQGTLAFSTHHTIADHDLPRHVLARYSHDIVLRFSVRNEKEAVSLAEASDTLFLDVWECAEDWVDLRLPEQMVVPLLGLLPESLQHAHQPLMTGHELAYAVARVQPEELGWPRSTRRKSIFTSDLRNADYDEFFREYRPLSVIVPWMRLLQSMFSTHVRLISLGHSYEGREIPALRVGVRPSNENALPEPRKTIVITGGSHAREWIGVSTSNYLAYSLITSYGKIPAVTKLLEQMDFVIVPTLNPDGYAYTWGPDRFWRKNRQPTSLPFCRGIDLDRAFGFKWEIAGQNTAGNPCSESYAGEQAYEAVEARVFADWASNEITNENSSIVAFLDLHAYSQQVLMPYSFTCLQAPPNLEDLQELGEGLAKSIRREHHVDYSVMRACKGNYASSRGSNTTAGFPRIESAGGSPLDWIYHELGVKMAYQIKLRDKGSYGFLLPPSYIVPTGEEIFSAVMHLGRTLAKADIAKETEFLSSPSDAMQKAL